MPFGYDTQFMTDFHNQTSYLTCNSLKQQQTVLKLYFVNKGMDTLILTTILSGHLANCRWLFSLF